jgi:hypothetical protein
MTSEGKGLPRTMVKYRAGKKSGGGASGSMKGKGNLFTKNSRVISRGNNGSSRNSYLNSRASAALGMPMTANGISAPQSLNRRQEKAIEKMFASVTSLVAGMEATKGWAFCHPPNVIWKSLGQQANDEFKYILQRYYKVRLVSFFSLRMLTLYKRISDGRPISGRKSSACVPTRLGKWAPGVCQ